MSSTNLKKLGLVVVLLVIIGGIWYLEAMKVQPTGGSGAAQSLGLNADGTAPAKASSSNVFSGASSSSLTTLQSIAIADQKAGYQPAKEIVDPTGFINTSSTFTLGSLIGKNIILVDFWTYSCINCIRTIPHLNAWYQAYQKDGLTIVGVHTPEFDFEKDYHNVSAAVVNYGIQYPVVMDSDYGTWNAYGNLYWPHEYLIDMAGYIVHDVIGEGEYDQTEAAIRNLLQERASVLGLPAPVLGSTTVVNAVTPSGGATSPETYFGAERNQTLVDGISGTPGTQTLQAPSTPQLNGLYLNGTWNFDDQYATNNAAGAKIIFEYQASKVYFVASATGSSTIPVEVLQDGSPITPAAAGSDVVNGKVMIGASKLYNIVNNPGGTGVHTLELIIDAPGLQAFTFTFG